MTPYFSVVISLYNKEKHIQSTIESVLAQTFSDFEIVVINDGSTDTSETVVKAIDDARIVYYSQENKGVSAARNLGIEKAKATLIAFLDADDYWFPNHLETLKTLYDKFPYCGLYASAYEKQYNTVTIKSIYKNIPTTPNWMGIVDDYFESSLINSIAWTSAVMIPKRVFDSVGRFNENYNSGEDTDLWIRIALNHLVAFCNIVSAKHNIGVKNSITKTKLSIRKHFDSAKFEPFTKNHPNLKRYIDNIKFSEAIQHRLEGNYQIATSVKKNIHPNNLSLAKKLLLKMPKSVLEQLLNFRLFLRKKNIDLRVFR